MKRSIYMLQDEPIGQTYRQLVEVALDECAWFLLVVRSSIGLDPSAWSVLDKLATFVVEVEKRSQWPGTTLIGTTAKVYRCELCSKTVDVITTVTDRLFSWVQPQLPEDLCLLRSDGSSWLVTTAHERGAHLELAEHEKEKLLRQVPTLVLKEWTR